MAIVKITGTVERIIRGGVKIVEKRVSEKDGKEYTSRFTVWTDDHSLAEGDVVTVSGLLSVRQGREWTDREGNVRQSIDVNVNSPRFEATNDTSAGTGSPYSDVSTPDGYVGGSADSMPLTAAQWTDDTPF